MAALADRHASAADHGPADDASGWLDQRRSEWPASGCNPDASDARYDARHDADEHESNGNAYYAQYADAYGTASG